jgi:hypothetical protein
MVRIFIMNMPVFAAVDMILQRVLLPGQPLAALERGEM